MDRFINIEEFILKYLLYTFPLLIIFGNAIVNSVFIIISILYFFSCIIQSIFAIFKIFHIYCWSLEILLNRKSRFENSWLFLVWIIFILSLDIIYQSIYGYDVFNYVSEYSTRNSGFFFDELVAGGFLVSFVFLSIFLIINKNKKNFLKFFPIIFLIVVFLTGERANCRFYNYFILCLYILC